MENGVIVDDTEGNSAINTVVTSGDNPTEKNSVFTVDNYGNLAYRTVSKITDSSLAVRLYALEHPPIISARIAENGNPITPAGRLIDNFDNVAIGADWFDAVQGVVVFGSQPAGLYSLEIYAYILNFSGKTTYEVEIEQLMNGQKMREYTIYVQPALAGSNIAGYACFASNEVMIIKPEAHRLLNFRIKTILNAGTNITLRNFTLIVRRVGSLL